MDKLDSVPSRWRLGAPALILALVVLGSATLCHQTQTQTGLEEPGLRLPRIFNYELYLDKYNKFGPGRDSLRFLTRARLFIARTLQIFKHNALYASNSQIGYYLNQNMFTDMTPREIVRSFVSKDDGLAPVAGAKAHPNMPADRYMAHMRDAQPERFEDAEGDAINDGHSQADLSSLVGQLQPEDSIERDQHRARARVDFLRAGQVKANDESAFDIESVMRELKLEPRAARKIARSLAPDYQTAESKMIGQQARRLELIRRLHGIRRARLIAPSNTHFDPSLLPSQGLLSSVSDYFTGGYTDYDEDDQDKEDLEQEADPEEARWFISSMVSKVGGYFYGHDMSAEDDEARADSEHDEFEDARESFVNDERNESPRADRNNKAPAQMLYDIDWRQTGCISRTKHQIKCNSCYAFATLDLMEFLHCRQKKTQTEFSVQYIIDCGRKVNLNGCQGGRLSNVGMFIRTYGLHLNAVYPYKALEQQCPFDEASDREQKSYALKPKITGWRLFNDISAWYKWLPKTPIIVGINMPSDFLAYGGGIHDGLDCVEGMGHAMLLVGSGKQDGKPFWLLKNSYSNSWGEAGYFRLSKRAPLKCYNSAIVARADF